MVIYYRCSPDITAPTVTSVAPLNGATGVAVSTTVSAIFGEALNATTVSSSTFQLRNAANSLITATVTYNASTNTVILTPSAPLAYSTVYTATITGGTAGVKDAAGNALAVNYVWSFTTAAPADVTAPTVTSVAPVNGATGVAVSTTVSAIFSETLNASTISSSTFQLRNAANALITATVTYNASTNTAILTPSAPLAYSTVYTATITGGAAGVKDAAGNALASNYVWSFTTVAPPDITAPTVTSVAPVNGATGVAVSTTVSAIFSETLNASTISSSTFQLRNAANTLITATVTYNASTNTAILTPSAPLAYSTVYTATITGGSAGVKDVSGNALASNYVWSFTTVAPADVTAPTVTSVAPVNGATGVAITTTVSAIFGEALNATTVSSSTFQLRNAANSLITATVTYNASTNTTILTPSAPLAYSTVYTATITGGTAGVKDAAGNALAVNYVWSFTTAAPADVTAPTVTSVAPVNGATGVAVSTTVSAIFSETLNATTISSSTFQLRNAANTLITATVTYNASTNTTILTPSAPLAYSTVYTATITGGSAGVKDVSGNALASNYVWSFTTAPPPDVTAPTVTSVVPVNGATGVVVTTSVYAAFSEAINETTINASTFQLRNASNVLVNATFTYDAVSKIAVLTPTAALSGSTVYTATVSGGASGVKDLAGNALVNNYVWSFTTADITPPTIMSVTPVNGATGVAVSTTVSAIFSEAINATTISSSTFQLRNAANTLITATVIYNASTNTATLTPSVSLANSTVYTATITGGASGAKDQSGNALVNNHTWTFTTVGPVTVSIFQPTDAPVVPLVLDQAIEVGTKFRTTQNGVITGFRFYKGAGNAGTHTGHLWNSAGTLLAEATFVNETASGWQQVLLTAPVAISTGNTYIVSYFSSTGNYAYTFSYFTSAVVNGPLRALADGEDGGNGLYIYTAAPASPINSYLSSNYWADVVFVANTGPDVTAPVVTTVTPANAATNINITTSVTGNFSETVNASTVNSSTFELRNASNTLVPATVTYNAATNTATLTPSSFLASSAVYTATIKGGASGVKDLAGNAIVNDYTWTFTTVAVETFSIFQPTDVPAVPLTVDAPIEVGTKFRTTQNGFVTGFRFYKGTGNTGTHTGHLWNSAGTQLAEATFINETASGWQQVLLATPVAITTGNTYIVSYFSSAGNYSYTNYYFSSAVVNGPLRGLADGEDGSNGLYSYATVPTFPGNSFRSSSYWVDIVFNAITGPDANPPVVTTVTPANAATNINITTSVTGIFSEALNASTVNSSTVELRNGSNALVAATVTYNATTNTATLTPSSDLAYSTVYTAKIKGGASGVKDIAGNAMVNDYTWTFTTINAPLLAPTEGPGGPILVISSTTNPFSRYAVEILRAEGLNEFAASDISTVTATVLNNYDVVVLGEMTVTAAQVTMLTNWVNAGGTLIAFKPGSLLNSLLGISAATGTLTDKYLLVNTASGPGAGIVNQTMQFHGTANLHTLSGATSLATLYSAASTATTNPAVTTRTVGTNGGRAVAFTYDLAKSIIYTRQGNPAWAGQKRDGQPEVIRSDDMFYGGTSPDWIDFDKIAIPQADEQQRLLANIILQSNLHRKPLPRFWYLPRDLKAAIVMTGDDHAVNGTVDRFNHYLTLGPNTAQDIADWKAVRGTSYVYPNTPITNAQAISLQAQGFELALHPTTDCVDYTPASLQSTFTAQLAQFAAAYPGVTAPVTNRTHCLAWSDWSSTPKVELLNGIRLDVTYYYWPEVWMQNRPGMFTGSGMPMRFADLDGSLIDVYQAPSQMTDETNMNYTAFSNAVLDKAIGS